MWHELGNDPDDIQVLAVGTTAIPQHLPRYHTFLREYVNRSAALSVEARMGIYFAN